MQCSCCCWCLCCWCCCWPWLLTWAPGRLLGLQLVGSQMRPWVTELTTIPAGNCCCWKLRLGQSNHKDTHATVTEAKGARQHKKYKGEKTQRRQHNSVLDRGVSPSLSSLPFFLPNARPAQAAHFARKKGGKTRRGGGAKMLVPQILSGTLWYCISSTKNAMKGLQ